jgi:hypothetical protein
MTARALGGAAALRDAADRVETATSVQVLYLNGQPRCAFTAREIAAMFGLPYRWILNRIDEGRVRVIHEGLREKVIPVSELAELASWAEQLGNQS